MITGMTASLSDRTFAFRTAAVTAVFALLPLLRHGAVRWWLIALAAVLTFSGLAAPKVAHRLHVVMSRFVAALQWAASQAVLALLFFLVFTPLGLILRLLGRRPLSLGFDRAAATYWVARDSVSNSPSSMNDPF